MTIKTALITGGAKRIGREISLLLAKLGYNILLHYNHSMQDAALLQTEIESLNVTCKIEQADFANEREVDELFANYSFDLLINNASEFHNCNIHNINYFNLETHFRANVFAPISLSRRFIKNLEHNGDSGNIINILDYTINKMSKNFVAYALSKKSLWEFTQLMASEAAPNVRVNAIALNNTLKPDTQSHQNFTTSVLHSPLQRSPTIQEIHQTISFILSCPSMTGQVIFLDGGKHLPNYQEL